MAAARDATSRARAYEGYVRALDREEKSAARW
jgi:hypothetical protein